MKQRTKREDKEREIGRRFDNVLRKGKREKREGKKKRWKRKEKER